MTKTVDYKKNTTAALNGKETNVIVIAIAFRKLIAFLQKAANDKTNCERKNAAFFNSFLLF